MILFLAVVFGDYEIAAQSSTTTRVQIVDQRGVPVRDAVIEITPSRGVNVSLERRPSGPLRMEQRNQEFQPGTLIVPKGATVAFPNLDRVRHSVYSFSEAARFEIELYGRDQTRSHRFPIAGTVSLGCNIHDNMLAYIRVSDTPFAAKTDHNGYASIDQLPTGSAEVTVWHPRLRAPRNEHYATIAIAAGSQAKRIQVRLR